MIYRDVIALLANNLAGYFSEVYHSVEIVTNDKGIKQPMVALGDEWISLVPTDQRETLYIRRNGDDETVEELKMGSCVKSYKMRSSLRIVFFQDHAKKHTEILAHLMQAVLVTGTKLKSISQNKWKLLKEESSGDYSFGATTAYFAVDIYALWHLMPDHCAEDFCIDIVNPLTCGTMPHTSGTDCCITLKINSVNNPVQNILNFVDTETVTVEYLGNGQVGFHCDCGNTGVIPQFQTNGTINDYQEVLNLVDSDTATFEYLLNGDVTVHCNCGESATLNLELGPIGSDPSAEGAHLVDGVLNLEPANLEFGGIVTASDTPQQFKGEKDIVSSTELIFQGFSDAILRTKLLESGIQIWYVHSGLEEVGTITFVTPNNFPGIAFHNVTITGRSQIRQYIATGGISLGSLTPAGIPDNQFVVLPNGHTFVTGYVGDVSGSIATPVVDDGFMFRVTGSAKITTLLNLPGLPTHADEAAALTAGLTQGDVYQTATGELRIKL